MKTILPQTGKPKTKPSQTVGTAKSHTHTHSGTDGCNCRAVGRKSPMHKDRDPTACLGNDKRGQGLRGRVETFKKTRVDEGRPMRWGTGLCQSRGDCWLTALFITKDHRRLVGSGWRLTHPRPNSPALPHHHLHPRPRPPPRRRRRPPAS